MVGVFIVIYLVIGFRHAQRKVNNPNPALRPIWASDRSLSQQQWLLRFWAVILLFPLSIDADRRSNTTQETFTPLIILIVSYMIFEVFSYRTGAICDDESESDATGSGACAWHGGVDEWEESFSYNAFLTVIGLIIVSFLLFAFYLYVKKNREQITRRLKFFALKALQVSAGMAVLYVAFAYWDSKNVSQSRYVPPAPTYQPVTPAYVPPAPTYQPVTPAYVPPAPTYQPVTPAYVPPAPTYQPVTPAYVPPAPTYQPVTPAYNPFNHNKGAIYECIDAKGHLLVTDSPCDGVKINKERSSHEDFNQALELVNQKLFADAFKIYLYWAEKGNAVAQRSIGVMYHDGMGVQKNIIRANEWYQKAANQGDSIAINALAQHNSAPSKKHTSASSSCDSGHWVESVSADGQIVKLEDGSVFEVYSGEAILWLPITDIIVCDDKLINVDDNETVDAIRIR